MRYILTFLLIAGGLAQAQDSTNSIRIADTLTQKEVLERRPVLLQSEVDSLVKLYTPPVINKPEVVSPFIDFPLMISAGLVILILLVVYLVFRVRRISSFQAINNEHQAVGGGKSRIKEKPTIGSLEKKISLMSSQLEKAAKEKLELEKTLGEYNGIPEKLATITTGINKAYKARYYPGVENKNGLALDMVFTTENSINSFAYNRLVKPLHEILDRNKNNPAKVSADERMQVMNLLLSLSLLYIETLYLKVQELSLGGNMVARLSSVAEGKATDVVLLKKLDTEFGSRALVLKMVLDKSGISNLAYPVFDETNLSTK